MSILRSFVPMLGLALMAFTPAPINNPGSGVPVQGPGGSRTLKLEYDELNNTTCTLANFHGAGVTSGDFTTPGTNVEAGWTWQKKRVSTTRVDIEVLDDGGELVMTLRYAGDADAIQAHIGDGPTAGDYGGVWKE